MGEKPFDKMKPVILLLLFVVVAGGYQFFLGKKIMGNGIYTKCDLINSEGYKGGVLLTIRNFFNGRKYEGMVHGS